MARTSFPSPLSMSVETREPQIETQEQPPLQEISETAETGLYALDKEMRERVLAMLERDIDDFDNIA